MLLKWLLFLLLTSPSIKTYSQAALTGKWRRVNPQLNNSDTADKKLRFGDMEIRSDTSFHIEGDSASQNSVIPGWHVGDEYNGTWERQAGKLFLWMEPKANKIFLPFTIVELTKDKLVLRRGAEGHKKHDITYLRL